MMPAVVVCRLPSAERAVQRGESWDDEFAAMQGVGLHTASVDAVGQIIVSAGTPDQAKILLRSEPRSSVEYRALEAAATSQGLQLLGSTQDYLRAQQLPGWIAAIDRHAAETRIVPQSHCHKLRTIAERLDWWPVRIKPFTQADESFSTIASSPDELMAQYARMQKELGDLGGGIALQRAEQTQPGTTKRFFVWHQNVWPHPDAPEEAIALARAVTRNFWHLFYSIDVAQLTSGHWRVMQLGDGQVSARMEWSAELFADFLRLSFQPHLT